MFHTAPPPTPAEMRKLSAQFFGCLVILLAIVAAAAWGLWRLIT